MLKIIKDIICLLDSKDKHSIYLLFLYTFTYSVSAIFPVFLIEKIVDSINIVNVKSSVYNIIFFGICYLFVQTLAQFLYALSNSIAEKTQINFGTKLQLIFFANLLNNP